MEEFGGCEADGVQYICQCAILVADVLLVLAAQHTCYYPAHTQYTYTHNIAITHKRSVAVRVGDDKKWKGDKRATAKEREHATETRKQMKDCLRGDELSVYGLQHGVHRGAEVLKATAQQIHPELAHHRH